MECWFSLRVQHEPKTHTPSGPWYQEVKQDGLQRPQTLISYGLVSICPGVTAHILSIPCLPVPSALPQCWRGSGGWGGP